MILRFWKRTDWKSEYFELLSEFVKLGEEKNALEAEIEKMAVSVRALRQDAELVVARVESA